MIPHASEPPVGFVVVGSKAVAIIRRNRRTQSCAPPFNSSGTGLAAVTGSRGICPAAGFWPYAENPPCAPVDHRRQPGRRADNARFIVQRPSQRSGGRRLPDRLAANGARLFFGLQVEAGEDGHGGFSLGHEAGQLAGGVSLR